MPNSGKCPHCNATVDSTDVENIAIRTGLAQNYKGATYLCPHCHSVLGVQMDPIALNHHLVEELLKALGKG